MSPALLAAASAHLPASQSALDKVKGIDEFPHLSAAHLWASIGVNAHPDIGNFTTMLDLIVNDLGLHCLRGGYRCVPSANSTTVHQSLTNQSAVTGANGNQTWWDWFQQAIDAGLKVTTSFGDAPIWSEIPWAEGGTQGTGGPPGGGSSTRAEDWFNGWYYWYPYVAAKRAGRSSGTNWMSSILAWEPPNEWNSAIGDNSDRGYKVQRWWCDRAARALRRDRDARLLPLLGPSPGDPAKASYRSRGEGEYGRFDQLCDMANPHNYTGNTSPAKVALDISIRPEQNAMGLGPDMWSTECGFQGQDSPWTTNPAGFTGMFWVPLPRTIRALYYLRLYLFHYWTTTPQNTGIVNAKVWKTFAYEIRNTPADNSFDGHGDFGIYRNDYSQTPEAVAIKNLVTLLGTKSAPSVTDQLSYSVSGFNSVDTAVSSGRWYTTTETIEGPWGNDADNDRLYHFAVKRADNTYLLFLFRSHPAYVWDMHRSQVPALAQNGRVETPAVGRQFAVTVTIPNATAVATANPRLDSTFTTATLNSAGTPSANYQFTYSDNEVRCLRVTM